MQGNDDNRNYFIASSVFGYPGGDDGTQTCRVSNVNRLVAQ